MLPGLFPAHGKRPADPGTGAGRDPARRDATEEKAYLGGLAVSPDGGRLYVANVAGDSLCSAIDSHTGALRVQRRFAGDGPARSGLRAAGWQDGLCGAVGTERRCWHWTRTTLATRSTLTTGSHRTVTGTRKDGAHASLSRAVMTIRYARLMHAETGMVREKMNMRLTPRAPAGATPSALALSPDQGDAVCRELGQQLDVAVVDVRTYQGPDADRRALFRRPGTRRWSRRARMAKRFVYRVGQGIGNAAGMMISRPIDPIAAGRRAVYCGTAAGCALDGSGAGLRTATGSVHARQVYTNSPYSDALLDAPAKRAEAGQRPIPSKIGRRRRRSSMCSLSSRRTAPTIRCWAI